MEVPQNPSEQLSRMSILKKSRSRGALGEGYARPRTPSPNRLFSVPSANSELIFILDGPKTAILAFFGTLKCEKKTAQLSLLFIFSTDQSGKRVNCAP